MSNPTSPAPSLLALVCARAQAQYQVELYPGDKGRRAVLRSIDDQIDRAVGWKFPPKGEGEQAA